MGKESNGRDGKKGETIPNEIDGGNHSSSVVYVQTYPKNTGVEKLFQRSRKKIVKRAVLVLNRNYIPCYITNLKHAFSLLFRESAQVVDFDLTTYSIWEWLEMEPEDGDEYISTVSRRIKIPRIIVADTTVAPRLSRPKLSRLGVFIRDGFRCQYCGRRISYKNLTIDHVIPRSRGGRTEWTNVVSSCVPCNTKKGDRTPEEAGMRLLREPRPPLISIMHARDIELKFYPEWEPYLLR